MSMKCKCKWNRCKVKGFTSRITEDELETGAIDGGHQGGVALLRIFAQSVVDVGFGHREEDAIDHVDHPVGGLNVGFHQTGSVHRNNLTQYHPVVMFM